MSEPGTASRACCLYGADTEEGGWAQESETSLGHKVRLHLQHTNRNQDDNAKLQDFFHLKGGTWKKKLLY